jgi:hypothetical protein
MNRRVSIKFPGTLKLTIASTRKEFTQFGVGKAMAVGNTCTGSANCTEPGLFQQNCATRVPGIRHDEAIPSRVQALKFDGFLIDHITLTRIIRLLMTGNYCLL